MSTLTLAYYCSGHGYGHATRVSAFATHLRRLPNPPLIYIVSSAPEHVFAGCIDAGAQYRRADIDPVIVQPVAYHVDRRKSVDVLKTFLEQEQDKLSEEVLWLRANKVNCVLSDAAYLACKAANAAEIPSVLITNFTFDSVYSYLSVELPESSAERCIAPKGYPFWDESDCPIPCEELQPLVTKILDGYRCAQLLLRLPGYIPIPSFTKSPCLPSHLWTDGYTFLPVIESSLLSEIETQELLPSIPLGGKSPERKITDCPLIVRQPSKDVYTPSGKKRVLDYIGVPSTLQSPDTKILIVSFGGQIFRKPSSRAPSRQQSVVKNSPMSDSPMDSPAYFPQHNQVVRIDEAAKRVFNETLVQRSRPIATPSHLYIPGAPPTNITSSSPTLPASETIRGDSLHLHREHTDHIFTLTPPTPAMRHAKELTNRSYSGSTACSDSETDSDTIFDSDYEDEPQLLPDSSWIAIVCGASGGPKKQNGEDDLPENFFVAPNDVYMPDLTALADVLLGKLGYGTVSECVDACTPFVYVPRPLFIEEHGLRRLLDSSGVGVQLSREQYEAGDWASFVEEARKRGRAAKARKREVGDDGKLQDEGGKMAARLLEWVRVRDGTTEQNYD